MNSFLAGLVAGCISAVGAENEERILTETEAAEFMRVTNAAEFRRLFVWTGQIKPIIYPGTTRRKYKLSEVKELYTINQRGLSESLAARTDIFRSRYRRSKS